MDNQEHKNLKDLLGKQGSESLDDFEKEALEGFDTLGSEQEALDLKSQLDKRMQAEVFVEKKQATRTYWYAAAGLILVVGLSVFFLKNNTNLVSEEKLALNQTKTEETAPEEIQKQDKLKNAEDIQTVSAQQEEKEPAKTITLSEKAESAKPGSFVSGPEGKSNLQRLDVNGASAGKKANGENDQNEIANKNLSTSALDDLKKTEEDKSPKDAIKDKDAAPAFEQKVNNGNVSRSEGEKEEAKKSADGISLSKESKAKLKEQNLESESKKPIRENNISDELAGEKGKEAKRKKNEKKTSAVYKSADIANTNNINQPVINPKAKTADNETEKKADTKVAPSSAPSMPETKGQVENTAGGYFASDKCSYTGGDISLQKDVREKLTAIKVDKKFDAVLYINNKKIVEKVTFANKYNLNKDDEIHVEEILKTLNKFVLPENPKVNGLYEYKLLYRP